MERRGACGPPAHRHVKTLRRITAALAVVGALLLALHLGGRVVPLRNPAIYSERTPFPHDIQLTYEEARSQLVRRAGETAEAYALRAHDVVTRGMAHYWRDDGVDKYHLRLPPWENYVLWAASFVRPGMYRKWEFADPDRALERGVGLCSQAAIVLVHALRNNGVPAVIVGLDGHVVAMAAVAPGKRILLDADYGVVVPFGLTEVSANPDLVRPYYAAKYPPAKVDQMVGIYGPKGNFLDPSGAANYTAVRHRREVISYTLCWVIPLVLMAPYGLVLAGTALRRRLKRRKT